MAEQSNNQELAETVGLRALAFLLATPRQLERFLGETGLSPAAIRDNAEAPELLEAALNVLVNDEALLLAFAANGGLTPEDVVAAHDYFASHGRHTSSVGST
jgi:hypothetical protein